MPSTRNARYIDVLTLPDVPRTFLSALLARSAYALVILPLFFAVEATSGSVATAGIAAAYGAAASFLAPLRAQLIDRHGRRVVLLFLALAFGGFIATMAVGALVSWSGTVMVVLAALAPGISLPDPTR